MLLSLTWNPHISGFWCTVCFLTWLESLHSSCAAWFSWAEGPRSPFSNLYSFQTAWSSPAWKRLFLAPLKSGQRDVYFLSHRHHGNTNTFSYFTASLDARLPSPNQLRPQWFRKCLYSHCLQYVRRTLIMQSSTLPPQRIESPPLWWSQTLNPLLGSYIGLHYTVMFSCFFIQPL